MKPPMRLFYMIAAAVALVAIGAVLYGIRPWDVHASDTPPPVLDKMKLTAGRPAAPEIAFTGSDGKAVKLADYRGRYLLVNLWATWCGPCILELPELAKLQRELPQERVTVVPVDVLERLEAGKL